MDVLWLSSLSFKFGIDIYIASNVTERCIFIIDQIKSAFWDLNPPCILSFGNENIL